MAPSSSSPDPEVPAKATRRRFSAADKARILVADDNSTRVKMTWYQHSSKPYVRGERETMEALGDQA
jgi:hypothetical protein